MNLTVKNNMEERRFEAKLDDYVAFVEYRLNGNQIILVHTEVPQQLGGRGVGSQIVKSALDFAKSTGLKVVPECPFVSQYLERHKEYQDIVAT